MQILIKNITIFFLGIYLLFIQLNLSSHENDQIQKKNSPNLHDFPIIKDLNDKHNPIYQQFIQEIHNNRKRIRKNPPIPLFPLRIALYRVKKKDSIWRIIRDTYLDLDSLAHINRLSSLHDIRPSQWLLLPNQRGTWRILNEGTSIESFSRQWKVPLVHLLSVNKKIIRHKGKRYLFIPGGKFTALERSLFYGTAFLSPLRKGKITSKYGYRLDPFTWKKSFHSGIDIAAPRGSPVYASRRGLVSYTGWIDGYGKTVIIRHDLNYETIYGHLSRILVKKNSKVNTGSKIGQVGSTGRSTGPHLHFEVRRNGKKYNPYPFIRNQPLIHK